MRIIKSALWGTPFVWSVGEKVFIWKGDLENTEIWILVQSYMEYMPEFQNSEFIPEEVNMIMRGESEF